MCPTPVESGMQGPVGVHTPLGHVQAAAQYIQRRHTAVGSGLEASSSSVQ